MKPNAFLNERVTLLMPASSHDWMNRFIERLLSLRPDLNLTWDEAIEIAVDIHEHAAPLEPERAARYVARERLTTLRDQLQG